MRPLKLFLAFLFLATALSFSQERALMQKELQEKSSNLKSYPVDVRPYLEKFNKANGIDEKKISEELQQAVLHKTTGWNFTVGSTKNWFASDLTSNAFYSTSSTCRAVGTNCYVFVEDSLWNARVNQTVVDSVMKAFDSSTPANANKGIYQTDVDAFGKVPNVDGDAKIIIFILNIRDGYTGSGGYVAGYFHSINESLTYAYSNKAEIYYLDANPADLLSAGGLQEGMSTTAHEFQHMIHFNYLPNDETFFNESWSLAAEVICGYSLFSQSYYNNETNHYLLDWRSDDNTLVLNDYSRGAKFGLYLYEQYGTSIFKNYLANKVIGITGVNSCLQSLSPATDFKTVLGNWWVANYLNDQSVAPGLTKWGYNYSNIIKVTPKTINNPNVTNASDAVYTLGAKYISFISGTNLSINFNTSGSADIKIKAIKTGASSKAVEDVTPGTDYSVPDFGTTYNNVSFMVYHDNQDASSQGPFAFSYTSTGTYENKPIEIAYDTQEPVGILTLAPGDSVAVVFDGVAGCKLDSISVALRQAGSVYGGIYGTATSGSSLGGKILAAPITVTSTISTKPSSPYPIPWPNWVTLDVRSNNIDAGSPFVVSFLIEGTYPATNRVMITDYESTASYHSFFYQKSTGKWVYYSDSGNPGFIFLNLIRAYVSDNATGVEKVIELTPSSYALDQNYPNPFNPATTIKFSLPKKSFVTLKVFDILGKEVQTLVQEERAGGNYEVTFDATKLTSGVYFYTLQTDNFLATKKLVLLK